MLLSRIGGRPRSSSRSQPSRSGRIRQRLAGCVVPLLAAPAPGLSQASPVQAEPTATLSGLIIDSRTRLPVYRALITLQGMEFGATTGRDGYFVLEDVVPGERFLEVAVADRRTAPHAVELEPGRHTLIRIAIALPEIPPPSPDDAVSLPPLEIEVVRADRIGKLRTFYRRLLAGRGRFLTRADIERFSPTRTTDLLRTIHGLRIDDGGPAFGRVRSNRGCTLPVFLDGVPIAGLRADDIAPGDIEGIEIYATASETPPGFRTSGGCGALIIWTREPGEP